MAAIYGIFACSALPPMPLSFSLVRRSSVRPATAAPSPSGNPWRAVLAGWQPYSPGHRRTGRRLRLRRRRPSGAAQLAERPYKAPSVALPKTLQNLTYDQYRDIRFKPAMAIWRNAGLPFELQLFHPGLYYDQPVKISEIVRGQPREIRFDADFFDYGKNDVDPKRAVRPRVRRLPRPLSAQQPQVQGRGARVPGRELLPRTRQGPALRPVGARPRDRHRAALGRGVPALRGVLDRASRAGCQGDHDLRAARFASASPAPIASCSRPARETVTARQGARCTCART